MQIGVDATCWQNTRGYGRYARSLLSTLVQLDTQNHYTFFLDSMQGIETIPSEAEVKLVNAASPTAVAAAASGRRSLGDMGLMSWAMSKADCDVLLFPTVYSYVPVFSRAKKIVMIMDVIAETYPELTLPSHSARLFWKIKVMLGRWQANAIITLSEYSRKGIIDHFGLNPDRVLIAGAAKDAIFNVIEDPKSTPRLVSLNLPVSGRSVVYVGGFGPHKNLKMLIDQFAQIAARDEFKDVQLIMVGEYKKEVFFSGYSDLKHQIDQLKISDRVIFTGFLPDEDLVVLLNHSTVLVLPSLMEGLGLPALEAVACGCPVIATTASPLPDLLGEGGLFIDPNDPAQLERAFIDILGSEKLRQQIRSNGLDVSRNFTWNAVAANVGDIIQRVNSDTTFD